MHENANAPVRHRTRPALLASTALIATRELRLLIEYVDTNSLKEPPRKLRKHGDRGLGALRASINTNGFIIPIVADGYGRIVAGYGRWLAAKELGLVQVPVIRVTHLSNEQLRVFAIFDNKSASLSDWNMEELKVELTELTLLDTELSIEETGFCTAELDKMLDMAANEEREDPEDAEDPDDQVPDLEEGAVTQPGDVWELGEHRLICGNSLEAGTFETLLGGEKAQMVFADAPYNVPASTISGSGKHKHRDFAMASGEMSVKEFTTFLTTSFKLLARFSTDGSIQYQCMDFRHMREMLDAGYSAYTELKNLVVWKKTSAGMGTFYRSQHELVFVFKNGTAAHINNFGLGENGRYRTNVVEYPGNAGFHKDRDAELASHPTVKPWSLVADFIRDCSKRGGIILDPFGGAGTTLIAAERTGRKARLIELEPRYCDVTIRRWQKLTGKDAVLAETGEMFDELEARLLEDDNGGGEANQSSGNVGFTSGQEEAA
jgi:DNA modification methylase